MALLARRPDSSLLRLMVFPVVVLTSLRVALWHVWMEPEYLACNALKSECCFLSTIFNPNTPLSGYVCAVLIAKAVDYAFYTDGIQRCNTVVEKVVEVAEDYEIGAGGITSTAPAPRILHPRWPYFDSILSPVSDAIDLACSMRGIGFEHGKGLVIPPESRPLKRKLFLWATFRMFLTRLSITDAIDTVFKLASPFGTPKGGSVFIHTLPWAHRYLLSTFYHILTGCMVIYMFELVYSICTLIAVGIFAQSPEEWPPIFNNPFASESLHEFWGVRWHQILRRVFFLFGGFPGYLIAERLGLSKGRGLLFGTFIASGFYHELPLYALGHGIDYRMPAFFILQAFFMLGERKWKRVTGHPVRGWLGRVWVLVSVIITGQNTCEYFNDTRPCSFYLIFIS